MSKTPVIGILETGRPPEHLAPEHGNYPSMVKDWLDFPEADYISFAALDGELPADPRAADLWIITGSRFGVYEGHPWIAPLEGFVRACRDAGVPMVGICFGHQVIAQALGGDVGKSDKGWGLGVHDYTPHDWPEALGQAPEKIAIQAYHQDQVFTPPEGAKTIASSPFCEHAALWYPGFALTVQGHPEFGKPYTQALLESRRGTVLKPEEVDVAQGSMGKDVTRADLARIVREHLLPARS